MISERLSNFGGLIPNKDIHHITSTISHELRTPLNAIMGFSELIQEESTNCEIKRFAKIIQDSGASLLNKIHSIIDYNILDLCNDIFIEEIDLKQFVYSLWDDFKDQIKDHNEVQFEVDYPGEVDDLTLFSDSKKIRYIISQLLSNSIKFTQSGKIIIGVKRTFEQDSCNDSVQIFVSDTGEGISVEKQNYIFKPFVHDEDVYIASHEGVGVGLAICQKLAIKIGATINHIPNIGTGTKFLLSLPVSRLPNNLFSGERESLICIVAEDDTIYHSVKNSLNQYNFNLIRIVKFIDLENILFENDFIRHIIIADTASNNVLADINNLTYKFIDKIFFLFLFSSTNHLTQLQRDNLYVFNSIFITQGILKITELIKSTKNK